LSKVVRDVASEIERKFRLKRNEGVAEGVRRIAHGRAEKALEALAGIEDGDDFAVVIHSARKDLKKLRAALRLVRGELGEKTFRTENCRYRDAGRLLARSRDAEVKLQTLTALEKRFGERLPVGTSASWSKALEHERDQVSMTSDGPMAQRIERAREEIEEGRDRISVWSLEADSWKPVGAGLVRSYRQGRRKMRRTLAEPTTENVHEWRKRVKDLWYQLRIVRNVWPSLIGETADRAHELADLLGDHHDLAVLKEDLARREELDRGQFETLIDRRQAELLEQALELGSRLYVEKPKAFNRRLKAYWKIWREG
jgi:CHAD domain-containing protein